MASVDIAAPGVQVWNLGLGGNYIYLTGTSMATPPRGWCCSPAPGQVSGKQQILSPLQAAARQGPPFVMAQQLLLSRVLHSTQSMTGCCTRRPGAAPVLAGWCCCCPASGHVGIMHSSYLQLSGTAWLGQAVLTANLRVTRFTTPTTCQRARMSRLCMQRHTAWCLARLWPGAVMHVRQLGGAFTAESLKVHLRSAVPLW